VKRKAIILVGFLIVLHLAHSSGYAQTELKVVLLGSIQHDTGNVMLLDDKLRTKSFGSISNAIDSLYGIGKRELEKVLKFVGKPNQEVRELNLPDSGMGTKRWVIIVETHEESTQFTVLETSKKGALAFVEFIRQSSGGGCAQISDSCVKCGKKIVCTTSQPVTTRL
jgi:hypothetical protein